MYGYELICAAADPTHPIIAELAVEVARFYGYGIDPADFEATAFDRDEVNRALAGIGVDDTLTVSDDDVPGPLAEILDAVGRTTAGRLLRGLIGDARLDEDVAVDAHTFADWTTATGCAARTGRCPRDRPAHPRRSPRSPGRSPRTPPSG